MWGLVVKGGQELCLGGKRKTAPACQRMRTSSPYLSNRDGITGIHTEARTHTHHHNYMTGKFRKALDTELWMYNQIAS